MFSNLLRRFRRVAHEPTQAEAGAAHALPGALRHQVPAPPAATPRRRGLLSLALAGAEPVTKAASAFEDRMQAGGIVFYASREEYSGCCTAPSSSTDDIRERILRLLEASDSIDVMTPILRLPSDARARLVERLQAYGTYEALGLVSAIADATAVTPA